MDFSVIKGYHSGICIMSHNILVILRPLNKQWCFFVIAGFAFPTNEHQVISWTNDDSTLGSTMCYNKQQRNFHWKPLTFIFSQIPIMHRPFGPHILNIHLNLKFLVIDGWGIFCEITLSWTELDLSDDKPLLVEVMAWFR